MTAIPDRTQEIADLQAGKTIIMKPVGSSMAPRILVGSSVEITPAKEPRTNDIVFCKVDGHVVLHQVMGTRFIGLPTDEYLHVEYLIADIRGGNSGWTTEIYGVVTKIIPRD